jgi:hypothetical protein
VALIMLPVHVIFTGGASVAAQAPGITGYEPGRCACSGQPSSH